MQDLIPFFCADNLLHQRLCLRFSGQVVKTEENPPSAFVTQSHVPRCFIEVSLKTSIPDTGLFRTKKPRIRDGCFKAYLYKAARHMALRHKSRRRIFFSLDDLTREPEAQTLVEEVVSTKERNQILHLCMDELNSDYREALYLTYFEGMSYQQAAEVMGKSVKQITNMVYRGKERLRGLLKREGITDAEK